jgi:hypothetical protein
VRTELCAIDQAASWYRERMAWPVELEAGRIVLPMGGGMVAFDVPTDRAGRVRTRLESLQENSSCTPILLVKGPEPRTVFLAEPDHVVFGQFQMPQDVRFLLAPSTLTLPVRGAASPSENVWCCAPDPLRRWLFPASTVLAAVLSATPPQLRANNDLSRGRPKSKRLLVG